jgi:lysophospholipase L1-like esterase
MKTSQHPVQHTLVFMGALCLIFTLILSRPKLPDALESCIPRWDALHSDEPQMSAEAAVAILENYQLQPVPADSVIAKPDTTLPAQLKSVPQISKPVAPKSSVSKGSPENYNRKAIDQFLHNNLQLRGNSNAFAYLGRFFALLDAQDRTPAIHIFHFGDSQIEGDRITGVLREAWQETWGGGGPGLLSPALPIPSLAMRQKWSSGWQRHARYGKKDSLIEHDRYGVLAAFAHHNPDESADSAASIRLTPHPKGYRRNSRFNELHVLMGAVPEGARLHCRLNDSDEISLDLMADSTCQHAVIALPALDSIQFESLDVSFSGSVPEINGIGMWSQSGIVVHNIAMRGSSGTVFRTLDRSQFQRQLDEFRTGMIILQYGGNAVPYLQDAAAAERYGDWFASQIRLFQSIKPDTPIIVIGPSDMARKVDTRMETYPQLTLVRDALQRVAVEHDALYWDVFEVMGGAGSMAAWVQSEPPLASTDHIHFTPKGAREMAELFRKSIHAEWALWQNYQAEQSLVHAP